MSWLELQKDACCTFRGPDLRTVSSHEYRTFSELPETQLAKLKAQTICRPDMENRGRQRLISPISPYYGNHLPAGYCLM
jgi:hypothetical protein